jgi:class 3 adenylate cyclase/tetratricopeptide (TPR) repeat protein
MAESASPLEKRQISVLICDLVGFTAVVARVDPEELAEGIHLYRKWCARTIEDHGGTVAQYIGDGILAYFGYPQSHEDAAECAVRATLKLVGGRSTGVPALGEVRVHIGVATGAIVVGHYADPQAAVAQPLALPQHDIAGVGVAINLAARLQSLALPGTGLIADETRALTRHLFRYEDFGRHALKGFSSPQQVWRVISERSLRSRFSAFRTSAEPTPMVGRREELRRLHGLWEEARSGRGRVALLVGEPGVGKSRLSEALASTIDHEGGRCLWYACWPHLQNTPLAPLVRHLSKAIRIQEAGAPEVAIERIRTFVRSMSSADDELIPLLAALLGIAAPAHEPALRMSPQRQKARLFALLLRAIAQLAAATPTLVVIEDLHWVDPSTDELIGQFIEQVRSLPVLVVMTARPDFESHWDDQPHVDTVPIEPLDASDSIAMIEAIRGQRDMAAAAIQAIAQHADGLPLFIEDLTRDLLDRSSPSGAAVPAEAVGSIPATLADTLSARLDRLGSTRRIAQIAAVIGREFSYALLSKVCGMAEENLKEELKRLVASRLVAVNRASRASAYSFRHALVRDAAYASLLRKEQQALHARVAAVLVEDFPDAAEAHPEVLAQHFEGAGQDLRAVPHLVEAARMASLRSGSAEALALLQRALALLAALPPSRDRTEHEIAVYNTMGAVNVRHRGFSAQETGVAYRAALERCRELGDAPETCSVLSALGSHEITLARFAECHLLAEECLELADKQSEQAPHVMGHRLLGGTLFLEGDLAGARRHLQEALERYEREPALHQTPNSLFVQDHKSTALCYLALTLTIMGEVEAGRDAALAGLAHSRRLNDAHTVNFSLCYLAAVSHIAGDAEAAWAYGGESLSLAREQDFATWIGISQLIRGSAAIAAGRTHEGFAEVMAGITAHQNTAAVAYQTFGLSVMASAMLSVGRVAEANAVADKAIALAGTTGERFYLAELLQLKAALLARAGERAASEAALASSVEVAVKQGARLFESRARR